MESIDKSVHLERYDLLSSAQGLIGYEETPSDPVGWQQGREDELVVATKYNPPPTAFMEYTVSSAVGLAYHNAYMVPAVPSNGSEAKVAVTMYARFYNYVNFGLAFGNTKYTDGTYDVYLPTHLFLYNLYNNKIVINAMDHTGDYRQYMLNYIADSSPWYGNYFSTPTQVTYDVTKYNEYTLEAYLSEYQGVKNVRFQVLVNGYPLTAFISYKEASEFDESISFDYVRACMFLSYSANSKVWVKRYSHICG